MKTIVHLVAVVAALLFTASPAMACCFGGVGEHAPSESRPGAEMMAGHDCDGAEKAPPASECPGCETCAVSASADHQQVLKAQPKTSPDILPAALPAPIERPSRPVAAGMRKPPPTAPPPQSLLALKQQLRL